MKRRIARPGQPSTGGPKTQGPMTKKLVALTVKIDSETYVRLSTVRARERKTAQEILAEALRAYLDQS